MELMQSERRALVACSSLGLPVTVMLPVLPQSAITLGMLTSHQDSPCDMWIKSDQFSPFHRCV